MFGIHKIKEWISKYNYYGDYQDPKDDKEPKQLGTSQNNKHLTLIRDEPTMIIENDNTSKEIDEMVEHDNDTPDMGEKDHKHCYPPYRHQCFSFEPLEIPRVTTAFEFENCCDRKELNNIVQAFYDFVLVKKNANPYLVKVQRLYTNNDNCQAVLVRWLFGNGQINIPASVNADREAILKKYLEYMASI